MSWDEIHLICKAGAHKDYFSVGDTKTETIEFITSGIGVTGPDTVTVDFTIIDFDKDTISETGKKAAIQFFTNKAVGKSKRMDSASIMKNVDSDSLFKSALPSDLLAHIPKTDKLYFSGSSTGMQTGSFQIFPLAGIEINLAIFDGSDYGQRYSYFVGSEQKALGEIYWIRDRFDDSMTCCVAAAGDQYTGTPPGGSAGIVYAFSFN